MTSPQMELAEDGDLHARLKKQRGRPLKEEVILNCERRSQPPLLLSPTASATLAATIVVAGSFAAAAPRPLL